MVPCNKNIPSTDRFRPWPVCYNDRESAKRVTIEFRMVYYIVSGLKKKKTILVGSQQRIFVFITKRCPGIIVFIMHADHHRLTRVRRRSSAGVCVCEGGVFFGWSVRPRALYTLNNTCLTSFPKIK